MWPWVYPRFLIAQSDPCSVKSVSLLFREYLQRTTLPLDSHQLSFASYSMRTIHPGDSCHSLPIRLPSSWQAGLIVVRASLLFVLPGFRTVPPVVAASPTTLRHHIMPLDDHCTPDSIRVRAKTVTGRASVHTACHTPNTQLKSEPIQRTVP